MPDSRRYIRDRRLGSVEDRADCVRQCALIFQLWVSLGEEVRGCGCRHL